MRRRLISSAALLLVAAAIQRKIDDIMTAIEDGLYLPSMKQHIAELEREKQALNAQRS